MSVILSQNGWPASANRGLIGVKNYLVAGSTSHLSCAKLAAPLLVHFAEWFDATIEPIDKGVYDDWGYNYAAIPGQPVLSNHASGTAIDLNATKHPWKATHSGFTAIQEAQIRLKVRMFGLRWGWDYKTGWRDPMHYEINLTQAMAAARIAALKLTMPKEMK